MKFCYIDESGTGDEPYAVMAGIVVDAQRMHVTKQEWSQLLSHLSGLVQKEITEIHTRDFYAGNGPWRNLDGGLRAQIISEVFSWLKTRKHHVALVVVEKNKFYNEFVKTSEFADVKTLWRFLGLHLILGIQKEFQTLSNNKGNTVFVFDNEHREQTRFTDLIKNPPEWTDSYYSKKKKQNRLDQIIDVPYWGDSQDVALLQLADFVAYFVRRYIEIQQGMIPPKYFGEEEKVTHWFHMIVNRTLQSSFYPKIKKNRSNCAELFFSLAPTSYLNI
ncbi:MAG TPA: DUF3800 domain-containing protein [Chloroflexota bacterium]|nr:DUF3800 domain-containing protein [Chloroflexota bacterium]HUM67956.1 DUF3800 domain-containing protein [Chloroflexota bacterium]